MIENELIIQTVKVKLNKYNLHKFGINPIKRKMSKYVFRYYDLERIKSLLNEIGHYEFQTNLDNMKLPKPLRMKGFYLENNLHCTFLVYQYPLVACKIMKVDRYNLPLEGWEMFKTDN